MIYALTHCVVIACSQDAQTAAAKAYQQKLRVTSNSVYEAGAAVLITIIVVIINHCHYR